MVEDQESYRRSLNGRGLVIRLQKEVTIEDSSVSKWKIVRVWRLV